MTSRHCHSIRCKARREYRQASSTSSTENASSGQSSQSAGLGQDTSSSDVSEDPACDSGDLYGAMGGVLTACSHTEQGAAAPQAGAAGMAASPPASPGRRPPRRCRRRRSRKAAAAPPPPQAYAISIREGFVVKECASNFPTVFAWAQRGACGLVVNSFKPTRLPLLAPPPRLSVCGERILHTPNAGGSSVWSEVFSIEVLRCLLGAKLERTEMEIQYGWRSRITDYSAMFQGSVMGVSVTRAMKYKGVFTAEDAEYLLTKKLRGVLESTHSVITAHAWKRQILHMWTEKAYMVDVIQETYQRLPPELRADTLVVLTLADQEGCRAIFYNNASL
eukprot:CAMPEP_0177628552 /NCGR_PEP_ID=MMETSP0447-20121125/192_1 /TAXON_ID=0 /ORGANISM="Stygamoeba regulata, Strain BSH-02190019" /LENGTH=333 /DNA_ID=CAMNT_0019129807 /DNA_START=50 /DNA_END=1052 /DNA_ORIENTATION=+